VDATELRDFIRQNATRTAFRLETLQQYDPTAPDYRRYLDGEPTPNKETWLQRLRDDRDAGLYRHRVRIVTRPITNYTRYECEWGYGPNTQVYKERPLEDIRILDVEGRVAPPAGHGIGDFWLIDDQHVLTMTYDPDGAFVSAELDPSLLAACRQVRDALWVDATPFISWWAEHPELHRANWQVA
jgi:hypothetical protein